MGVSKLFIETCAHMEYPVLHSWEPQKARLVNLLICIWGRGHRSILTAFKPRKHVSPALFY